MKGRFSTKPTSSASSSTGRARLDQPASVHRGAAAHGARRVAGTRHGHDFHTHLDQEEVIVVRPARSNSGSRRRRPSSAPARPCSSAWAPSIAFNSGQETARLAVALGPCRREEATSGDVSGEEPRRPLRAR